VEKSPGNVQRQVQMQEKLGLQQLFIVNVEELDSINRRLSCHRILLLAQ
jgi:hypothetical protein